MPPPEHQRGLPATSSFRLIPRSGESVLNGPLLVARKLHRSHLDRQLVELAVEAERQLIVLVVDPRAGIDTHIEGLVDRDDERNGVWHRVGGDFLAVDFQHTRSALAKARSAISEVELDRVLARRERLLVCPSET